MNRPNTVTRATFLWLIAIGAGMVETALAVTEFSIEGHLGSGIWINVAVRILIYTGAILLVANLARGRRWARWCLTGLLSVIGLAAMVVPPIVLLAEGATFLESFGTTGFLAGPFLMIRAIHIAAVVAATVLMFTPSANIYFNTRRESEVDRAAMDCNRP